MSGAELPHDDCRPKGPCWVHGAASEVDLSVRKGDGDQDAVSLNKYERLYPTCSRDVELDEI